MSTQWNYGMDADHAAHHGMLEAKLNELDAYLANPSIPDSQKVAAARMKLAEVREKMAAKKTMWEGKKAMWKQGQKGMWGQQWSAPATLAAPVAFSATGVAPLSPTSASRRASPARAMEAPVALPPPAPVNYSAAALSAPLSYATPIATTAPVAPLPLPGSMGYAAAPLSPLRRASPPYGFGSVQIPTAGGSVALPLPAALTGYQL